MLRFLKAVAIVAVLIASSGFFLLINFRTEKSQMMDGEREEHFFFNKRVGERYYKNGVLDGATKTFYSDGSLKSEFQFLKGLREGTARHYTPEGNLKYEDVYAAGEKKSRKEYDAAGNVVSDQTFK